MAAKQVSHSVLFYKRMVAAVLMLSILTLAGLSIFLSVRLRRTSDELTEAQETLTEIRLKEAAEAAAEEAERLKNAIPPEQAKPAGEKNAEEILAGSSLIAHALGEADEFPGLNCREAFLASYDAGVRVFEADIRMTSDGRLVLRHDWVGGMQEGVDLAHIPTREEFLASPIYDQYTPLSFQDLLRLMVQDPDVCVITDTKLTDAEAVAEQFREMVAEAHELGLSYLFDRMIVQIYSPSHFTVVDSVRHFPYYIYTLYQDYFGGTVDSFRNKVTFCRENGFIGLTIAYEAWDDDYMPVANWQSVNVYIHTINTVRTAKRLLRDGVCAVYTDELLPADLAE